MIRASLKKGLLKFRKPRASGDDPGHVKTLSELLE